MTEADVALTDFALTIECAALSAALARAPRTRSSSAFVARFALSATATLLGGILHGFAFRPDRAARGGSRSNVKGASRKRRAACP